MKWKGFIEVKWLVFTNIIVGMKCFNQFSDKMLSNILIKHLLLYLEIFILGITLLRKISFIYTFKCYSFLFRTMKSNKLKEVKWLVFTHINVEMKFIYLFIYQSNKICRL